MYLITIDTYHDTETITIFKFAIFNYCTVPTKSHNLE